MSIADIAKLKPAKATWYKWVDSAMLVRAAAIVLVVALHLHVFSIGGGATTALFMVSGFLLGRLQLREAVRTGSSKPLWGLTGRVLLPSAIYCTIFYFAKMTLDKPVNLSVLLLYEDFVDHRDAAAAAAAGHAWFLWFIACFIHMSAALSTIGYVAILMLGQKLTVKGFAASVFILSLPLRFVLPAFFEPQILREGIPPGSVYGFLPTTHFATLALGICLANADTLRERVLWGGIALAYSVATYFYVPSNGFAIMGAFALLLLFARRLPIPNGLHIVVLFLSGASLFIYLTHQQAAQAFRWMGVPAGTPVLVALVLMFGIGLWLGWQRLRAIAHRASRGSSRIQLSDQIAD